MILQLLLAAEVGVDDGADVGGPIGESPHDSGPVQSMYTCTAGKSFLADRPVDAVEPIHQLGHLGCLPRPVTTLKHDQGSSLDG